MPSLRLTYNAANKSRGAKSKRPTSGCKAYAAERRGWKNKVKRLERHLKRIALSRLKRASRIATQRIFEPRLVFDASGLNVIGVKNFYRHKRLNGIPFKDDRVAEAALQRARRAVKGLT